MRPPKPAQKKEGADDARLVTYPQIRDRFLAQLPDEAEKRLESYVEIGRFIVDRWMAEADALGEGQDLDEQKTWHLWDQCTEKHLRDMRTEAAVLLTREMQRKRLRTFVADWSGRFANWDTFFSALRWTGVHMAAHIVGAVGLLIFAIIIAYAIPELVKEAASPFIVALHGHAG